jgi:hypothetical protein
MVRNRLSARDLRPLPWLVLGLATILASVSLAATPARKKPTAAVRQAVTAPTRSIVAHSLEQLTEDLMVTCKATIKPYLATAVASDPKATRDKLRLDVVRLAGSNAYTTDRAYEVGLLKFDKQFHDSKDPGDVAGQRDNKRRAYDRCLNQRRIEQIDGAALRTVSGAGGSDFRPEGGGHPAAECMAAIDKAGITSRFDQIAADKALADAERIHRELVLVDQELALRRPCLSDRAMLKRSDDLMRLRTQVLDNCNKAGQMKACLGRPAEPGGSEQ